MGQGWPLCPSAPERRNSHSARRAPWLARFVAALAAACDYRRWHSLDIGHVAFASRKVPEIHVRARARPRKARPPVASTFIMRTSAVCRDTTASLLSAALCARDKIILLRKWAASRFCDREKPIRKRQLKRCRIYTTRHFLSLCHHSISLVRFFSPSSLLCPI